MHSTKQWQPMRTMQLGLQNFVTAALDGLDRSEFSFKDQAQRLLRSRCRPCCRERSKRHYVRTKLRTSNATDARSPDCGEAAASFVHQFLLQHPCAHCAEEDPVVLEFN